MYHHLRIYFLWFFCLNILFFCYKCTDIHFPEINFNVGIHFPSGFSKGLLGSLILFVPFIFHREITEQLTKLRGTVSLLRWGRKDWEFWEGRENSKYYFQISVKMAAFLFLCNCSDQTASKQVWSRLSSVPTID